MKGAFKLGFNKLEDSNSVLSKCFERQYLTNMFNNIWFESSQTSQDTNQKIFALDPDGWVRVCKYRMVSTIFVNMIWSWRMSQGSANISWRIQSLWIWFYTNCVYDRTIFVNKFRSWWMIQGSVDIGWRIKYLLIWS